MRSSHGQASAEYVGAVAFVAVLLTVVATAVAAPGLPRAVVAKLRLALCVVGAGVCTPEDARARDLQPCPLARSGEDRRTGLTLFSVDLGGEGGDALEQRSDGTYEYSRYSGGSVGASVGLGVQLKSMVDVGAEASGSIGFRAGKAWILRDAAELREPLGEPTVRYYEGGPSGGLSASLGIGRGDTGTTLAEGSGGARQAIGYRTGPEGRTLFFENDLAGGADIAQSIPLFAAGGRRVVEWHEADPPVVSVRQVTRHGSRLVETVGRLTLRDRSDLTAAFRYTAAQLSPPAAVLAAGDFARRLRERGSVHRFTFDEDSDAEGWNIGAAVGLKFAARSGESRHALTLVDAELLHGGEDLRREDCLGLT